MTAPRPWVTGVGVVTPVGQGPAAFWRALIEGREGAAPVRSFDTTGLPNRIGCEVADFERPPGAAAALLGGRCSELALAAVDQAVRMAGLADGIRGDSRTAVVVGTTMGEVTRFEQDRAAHPDVEPSVEDVASLAARPLDVMGRSIAKLYGLDGPLLTVPAACAAGAYAVGFAASMVVRGECDRAIAVGCEAFSRLAFVGFSRMRAMSPDCCRPFSLDRPGLLLGEGAGALVIEAPRVARRRGAEPLASVSGFGLSCDAHHVTGPHPEGAGAARAMRAALADAALDRAAIGWVNAHGTGTPQNDRTEAFAVRAVFGAAAPPVSSIKALTGHTMGAAGALEAVASILALRHGVIPPTWNFTRADPDCPVDCVPNVPRECALLHVLSNSYAFGGNNASLVLSRTGA